MKLKSRTTKEFIELSVDEIETTIFKSDKDYLMQMRDNLLDVVRDLESYIDEEVWK